MTHEQRTQRRKKIADAVKAGGSLGAVARRFRVTVTTVKNACTENRVPFERDCLVSGSDKVLLITCQLMKGKKTLTEIGNIPAIKVTCEYIRQILQSCRDKGIKVHSRYRRE